VREYEGKYPLEEAIKLALKYCMENDILKEYLKQHLSEVIDVSMFEYNLKDAIEAAREEAMEKIQNYILSLIDQGLSGEEIKKRIEDSRRDFFSEK
jgi:peptide subunit release factor 1 (eRF1)